ncbi:MAG: undecaprenyldiphospho-muramoylpentapeptide beta-N-acetylglucosaminyltransferase [Candidatus Melainabacteria bacterium]|nr:undecaprenyldiphospho-muramoylpentapeptide beta-N-acetylglucosaminyltransferase [Candidatus Melainabacteria bacterium]
MLRHRIVLSGGGTGGHVYPALAVAGELKGCPDVESILYMGASGHLEQRLALEQHLEFVGLKVSGLPRKLSGNIIKWPFELWDAVRQARKVLKLFRPTAILGTGGYASAAPLVAAMLSGVPYAIHEPDAHPGLVNRLFASRALLVSLGMEAALEVLKLSKGKIVVNGNPVRESLVHPLSREGACAVLGLDSQLKTVLVTGGSQGSQAINDALIMALPALLDVTPPIQVIHQAGDKNILALKERLDPAALQNPRYVLRAYFEDLSLAYSASDLAVCRAGAMTVSELAVSGTPALFVPYPYASADHQTYNARYMVLQGAAQLILQSRLTAETLVDEVCKLLKDEARLGQMRRRMLLLGKPQAAKDLACQVIELSAAYQT